MTKHKLHSLCCFLCSQISFPCLYLNNNCSILFFLFLLGKGFFLSFINSISCFKCLSKMLGKIKIKRFGFSYHKNIFFHFYNDLIDLLSPFSVILWCWYKRYSICLILVFTLYELFPAFICSNNIGSLVNRLFDIKTFNPAPALLFLFWRI